MKLTWTLAVTLVAALVLASTTLCNDVATGGSPAVRAKLTGYCNGCDSSGVARSGRKFKDMNYKFCAADPRYWKPGTVIKFGPPVNASYQIEDTGGAVKGKHRFDLYFRGSCKSGSGCKGFNNPSPYYTVVKRGTRNW